MPSFPGAHLLVSATVPTLSGDYTIVRSAMTNGLPHIIDVTQDLRLKVTLATGLMQTWLDADPSALVASSDDELHPRPNGSGDDIGGVSRPALRLALIKGGSALSTMPAANAVQRSLPDAGDGAQGVALDIVLLGWSIFAGTLRGPGDFGSFIHLGWKTADAAVSEFAPPAMNPFLRRRLASVLTSAPGSR